MTNQLTSQLIKSESIKIPAGLVIAQSVCFAILYAVWMLPKTIFLRNTCLGIGALLSLFILFRYRKALLTKAAIPMYLLIAFYGWLLFHLLFLSTDYQAQYLEFTSVWKNSAIGIIFGWGFGISLASLATQSQKASVRRKDNSKILRVVWVVIWIGLIAPEVIYISKWLLMKYGVSWGLTVPDYLKLWGGSAPFYISKNTYVCFCLPVLAIALGQMKAQFDRGRLISLANLFYGGAICGVLFVFWGEKIFNGFIYALLCTVILGCILLRRCFKSVTLSRQLISIVFVGALAAGLTYQIKHDSHLQSFTADAKIAFQMEQYPQWKYDGKQGYPLNELGAVVNASNYERISFFIYGAELIPRYPLGYGLLQSSFGRLVKIDYPDSLMHQSHSGWLDLTLGIGLPGVGLILGALLLAMRNCSQLVGSFSTTQGKASKITVYWSLGWWVLLGLALIWCTTEISQKVYIDTLLFWIALATGLGMGFYSYQTDQLADQVA